MDTEQGIKPPCAPRRNLNYPVNPIYLGAKEGDLTKKQIKKLRKASSLFVSGQLTPILRTRLEELGVLAFLNVEAQPDGEGGNTYPEPRQMIAYIFSLYTLGSLCRPLN